RYIGPELKLVVGAMVILLLDLVLPLSFSKHLAWAAVAACLLPLADVAHDYSQSQHLFLGMVATDPFASFFKAFFLLGAVPVIVLSFLSKQLDGRRMGEYYSILLSSVFGGMLMASSTHFLMLFLSLEILSVSSYVLVGYIRSDRKGAEAALKYIIYGSIAAAILGYGLSLWYGLTGSGEIGSLAKVLWDPRSGGYTEGALRLLTALTATFALLFIFAGFAYKMAAIPMHFWAPDVYEGAPTAITAFLSVLSKAAGFAIVLRFLQSLADSIASLEPGHPAAALWSMVDWRMMMIVISIVTMTLGNLAALWQTNVKRLMAYSSIAHAGYLMIGLTLLGTATRYSGMQTIAFYLVAYLAMNLGAFAVVILVENRLGTVDIDGYMGLGKRAPFLALSLTVFLLSLIGVPPTGGFMGKFQLFMGLIDLGGWPYYLLAVAAVVNTAVSAYYYLKIAKAMYFDRGGEESPVAAPVLGHAVVLGMLVLTFYLCFRADAILGTTLNIRMHV
ncbi:MAG: NADH-quinone oxidoreductase subunit N, partial [Planctomycetes bacterium]|nr:NADH-quinone oxidoreductase subunit N [Planctomycetota bacterium]